MFRFVGLVVGILILTFTCTFESQAELTTYSAINDIRVSRGLPPLKADRELAKVADTRSVDMALNSYFSHTPPNGCDYICLMRDAGIYFSWAGENIAWNNWPEEQSVDVAVNAWENSPPHLENILNCHYTRFGSGVFKAQDGNIYYTMLFEGDREC